MTSGGSGSYEALVTQIQALVLKVKPESISDWYDFEPFVNTREGVDALLYVLKNNGPDHDDASACIINALREAREGQEDINDAMIAIVKNPSKTGYILAAAVDVLCDFVRVTRDQTRALEIEQLLTKFVQENFANAGKEEGVKAAIMSIGAGTPESRAVLIELFQAHLDSGSKPCVVIIDVLGQHLEEDSGVVTIIEAGLNAPDGSPVRVAAEGWREYLGIYQSGVGYVDVALSTAATEAFFPDDCWQPYEHTK